MVFKNKNPDDIGLDRITIKLSDTGLTGEYQYYSIFPTKSQPDTYNETSVFL